MSLLKNEQYTEILSSVLIVFSQYFQVNSEEISFSDKIESLSKGNQMQLPIALLAIHENLGINPNYEQNTEFELFQTVGQVVKYFESRLK